MVLQVVSESLVCEVYMLRALGFRAEDPETRRQGSGLV